MILIVLEIACSTYAKAAEVNFKLLFKYILNNL